MGVYEDVVEWSPNGSADFRVEEVVVDGLGQQVLVGTGAHLGSCLGSWHDSAEVLEVGGQGSVGLNTRLAVQQVVEDLGSGSEDLSLVDLVRLRLLRESIW